MRARTMALELLACVVVACGPTADTGPGDSAGNEGSAGSATGASDGPGGSSAADSATADGSSAGAGGCPLGLVECGGACIDPQSDPNHCGGCDTPCGDQACAAGACVADCGALTQCGGSCVDLQGNPLHCGACDSPCDADELCGEGECERFSPTSCTACPCDECEDNCCVVADVVVCAMGECP